MDTTPTIYNRAIKCGRADSISAHTANGASITIEVTTAHSDADTSEPEPVYLEQESGHPIVISVPCRSTRDLHAFNASGMPVIYRIRAYHSERANHPEVEPASNVPEVLKQQPAKRSAIRDSDDISQ